MLDQALDAAEALRELPDPRPRDELDGLLSRNALSQFGAGLKSIVGGELKGMTKALHESRQQVIDRMCEEAEGKGANAVVAMRFDASDIGTNWTEICAYGTAVRIRKM